GPRAPPGATAVQAGREGRRLPLRDPGEAEAPCGAGELPDVARDAARRLARDVHAVVRRACARDLLPRGHARLLPHTRLRRRGERVCVRVRRLACGRQADETGRLARRCAASRQRHVAAVPANEDRRARADGPVYAERPLIRAAAVILVVLTARSLAYATEPSPSARFLRHQAGGPALPVLALVALGFGAATAVRIAAVGRAASARAPPLSG